MKKEKKSKNLDFIPIVTDGTHFLEHIKEVAIEKKVMLPDSIYKYASELLTYVIQEHDELHDQINANENPQMIYAASYQDGMIHGMERVLRMRSSGHYSHSCNIQGVLKPYQDIQKECRSKKNYAGYAYIEGYINAMIYILLDEETKEEIWPPLYFAFGHKDQQLNTIEDYLNVVDQLPVWHKSSYVRAKQIVKSLGAGANDIEFHHPPWL